MRNLRTLLACLKRGCLTKKILFFKNNLMNVQKMVNKQFRNN